MNFLKIQKIEFTEETVEMYDITVEDNENFILANDVITHNSGKSFFMRARMSRYYKAGYAICNLNDIKNEYSTNNKPLQDKFVKFLGENEQPESIPTVLLIPKHLEQYYKKLPNNSIIFQFSLKDLSESDFLDILQLTDVNEREAGKLIYNSTKGEVKDVYGLKKYVDNLKDKAIHSATKKKIGLRLGNIITAKLLGEENNVDIVDLVKKGYVIDLGLKYHKKAESIYTSLYIGMVVKILTRAKEDDEIKKPLVFFIDEAHNVIPKNDDSPSRREVINSINVSRYLGISLDMATQYPSQLPGDDVLKQVNYFFLPYNIDVFIRDEILKFCGIKLNQDFHYDKWTIYMNPPNFQKFDWAMVDKDEKEVIKLKPAAPLCEHKEETREW